MLYADHLSSITEHTAKYLPNLGSGTSLVKATKIHAQGQAFDGEFGGSVISYMVAARH